MSKIPGRSRGFSFSALVCGVVWGNRNTSVSFCKYTGRLEVEVRVRMSMRKILRVQCEYRDCRGGVQNVSLQLQTAEAGSSSQAKGEGICGGAWGPGRRDRERENWGMSSLFLKKINFVIT
jgi:hypothetical protein